jgi:diguanylate cyclase (GGDEF)-like protein
LKNATLFHQALKMAYTDPLTQTNNRASFNDAVKREMSLSLRHTKSLSIIFLDIDHFTAINDQHGRECGDITLTAAAKWIKESLRSSDIVFRVGGEEFVILLSDTDLSGAEILAERIHNTIELHTLAYDMATIKITASLGVAALRDDDKVDTFIKRAVEAMCKAKKNGRNQVMSAR